MTEPLRECHRMWGDSSLCTAQSFEKEEACVMKYAAHVCCVSLVKETFYLLISVPPIWFFLFTEGHFMFWTAAWLKQQTRVRGAFSDGVIQTCIPWYCVQRIRMGIIMCHVLWFRERKVTYLRRSMYLELRLVD